MIKRLLFDCLDNLIDVSELRGSKFAVAVTKNKNLIQEELQRLQELINPTEKYVEYENRRIVICEKHSNKDDKGNAIINDKKYDIIDYTQFNKELDELKGEYVDELKNRENQVIVYNEELNKEIDMKFFKVTEFELPLDITSKQIDSIIFMIDIE